MPSWLQHAEPTGTHSGIDTSTSHTRHATPALHKARMIHTPHVHFNEYSTGTCAGHVRRWHPHGETWLATCGHAPNAWQAAGRPPRNRRHASSPSSQDPITLPSHYTQTRRRYVTAWRRVAAVEPCAARLPAGQSVLQSVDATELVTIGSWTGVLKTSPGCAILSSPPSRHRPLSALVCADGHSVRGRCKRWSCSVCDVLCATTATLACVTVCSPRV